jgi:hypothetical protein
MPVLNKTEPLGLPAGTVRAVITLTLLVALIVTLFLPVVPAAKEVWSGLLALLVMAVRDYFAVRADTMKAQGPPVPPPANDA